MNLESIGKNLKNENIWRRLIYIVVFALAFSAVEIVIWSLLIIQFLSQLFSGKPSNTINKSIVEIDGDNSETDE